MSWPDDVFRHTPELAGAVLHWSETQFRGGHARYAELDEMAAANGQPPDWRLSHEEREANRRASLAGRDGDLWVFAYGSLMWDPGVRMDQVRRARLEGWRRSFCLRLTLGRGTQEAPGLMAALEEGGACDGLALRIPAELAEPETEHLWMREMIAGAYRPVFAPVKTPQGEVEALLFAINTNNERYFPCEDQAEAAGMIARAEGTLGPNIDYLINLSAQLSRLGIPDPELDDLIAKAEAVRNGPR